MQHNSTWNEIAQPSKTIDGMRLKDNKIALETTKAKSVEIHKAVATKSL